MPSPIKVISWNVQHSADADETIEALKNLNSDYKPDAILLQELTKDNSLNEKPDMDKYISEATGLKYKAVRHQHKSVRFFEGVGIFTKHDIARSQEKIINERRGVQKVRLKVSGYHYNFYSVHITSPVAHPKAYKEECDIFIKEIKNLPENSIIGGDFNSPPSSKLIKKLQNSLIAPAKEITTWHKSMPVDTQLDYIFCTSQLAIQRMESLDIGPSDHQPLYAEISRIK